MALVGVSHPLPPLEWLRAFEVAARRENFTTAAEELNLTQAAVSQQIRKLEARLGVMLFRRLPRGVQLTAEGLAYLPHVQASFGALARSTQDLFGAPGGKTVSIASPISFAALWLAPKLTLLRAVHPGIRVAVSSVYRPVDYETIGADLEIRFGSGTWDGKHARHLETESLAPVCTPELLAQAPEGDWMQLPVLGMSGPRSGWHDWTDLAGTAHPGSSSLLFDSFILALEAAKDGAGVLLASLPLTQSLLDAGRLVQLSPVVLTMSAGHWLVRDAAGAAGASDVEGLWNFLSRDSRTHG
ncbi:LysR family transcriptional regulator [Pelagibius sp. Alg239-R121]|uniref:LysR family transcriptional regulator n=1 Tax=Pelagibius sp. Alg239-R121 TaxID=2993448 RepID=UPI0024A79DDA|nr:LysR family transcriptional regulator [Pelagibius sp. Alg239-R121]